MTVKEKITKYLEANRGSYISGEALAKEAGCTRGAVWKAIRVLQSEGCAIDAVTNRGYCLLADNDILSAEAILSRLPADSGVHVEVYKITDSTNTRIKELAAAGAPEWTIAISGEQTGGKGRLGRGFYSPRGTGLYMSLLLRPKMSAGDAVLITAAAAVAVAEAVEELSGRKTAIKWVNDIYIDGRKICGILTEASLSLESGGIDYAALGIGINVYEPVGGFPEELRDKVGAVFSERRGDMRSVLAAAVTERFMRYYAELDKRRYISAYREKLMWKGEEIRVLSGAGIETAATLIDADENASLIVRYEDGTEGLVSSGEISIRLKESRG